MALSLKDVSAKSKKKPARKTKAKATSLRKASAAPSAAKQAKAPPRKKRAAQKPWQSPVAEPKAKFARAQMKNTSLADDIGHDFSSARLEENWLFHWIQEKGFKNLLSAEAVKSLSHGLMYQVAKRSYTLSKAQKSLQWLRDLRLSPKVRIPVPPIFRTKDRD